MKTVSPFIFPAVLATAAIARAQPPPPPPDQGAGSGAQIGSDSVPLTGGAATPTPPPPPSEQTVPTDPYANAPAAETPKHDVGPHGPINMPEVLTTPTGWLLPAAVLYSRTSIDTGGGVTADSRVGLGDVAEFGLATTDAVREKDTLQDKSVDRIQPY